MRCLRQGRTVVWRLGAGRPGARRLGARRLGVRRLRARRLRARRRLPRRPWRAVRTRRAVRGGGPRRGWPRVGGPVRALPSDVWPRRTPVRVLDGSAWRHGRRARSRPSVRGRGYASGVVPPRRDRGRHWPALALGPNFVVVTVVATWVAHHARLTPPRACAMYARRAMPRVVSVVPSVAPTEGAPARQRRAPSSRYGVG